MKRELKLVKLILEKIEEDEELKPKEIILDDYSQEQISYHVNLLEEADYLTIFTETNNIPYVSHLTWDGHEFLDGLRNDTVMNKVKQKFGDNLSFIPFETLKILILESAKIVFSES